MFLILLHLDLGPSPSLGWNFVETGRTRILLAMASIVAGRLSYYGFSINHIDI